MKAKSKIPPSAATKNLLLCGCSCIFAIFLAILNAPIWIILPIFGIACGFLMSMISCILDIQEFTMQQNQKIIELLTKQKIENENREED